MEPAHHGAFGTAENLTDIFVGESFERSQHDDRFVFRCQIVNRLEQRLPQLLIEHVVKWSLRELSLSFQDTVHRFAKVQWISFLTPLRIDRKIDGDTV